MPRRPEPDDYYRPGTPIIGGTYTVPTYTERTQGIYRCTYKGWKEVTFPDKDDPSVDVTRWAWTFQEVADPSTAGEISILTGTSPKSPNSNAHKIMSGLVGRKLQPGDDTETHVGELYDVVYGPNQAGNLAITSVVRVQGEPQPAQDAPGAAPAAAVAPTSTSDDLDF